MNVDGSEKTVISQEASANYDRLEVSRNTARVLFTKFGGPSPSGVYWMKIDGTSLTGPLPDGSQYRWSPDATRLVFIYGSDTEPGNHLFVVNADGSGLVQVTSGAYFDSYPMWSPDGNKIVFARGPIDTFDPQVYVVNADGSGLTPLIQGSIGRVFPNWSPDGSRIAYFGATDPGRGVWVMNADGTAPAQISSALCTAEAPVWSPTGTYVLCIAPTISSVGPWWAYRVKADGTESVNLTPLGAQVHLYSWSQDGTRILFQGPTDAPSDIYVMNSDGTATVNLTHDPQGAWQPFWVSR